jgi:hypothetical protein
MNISGGGPPVKAAFDVMPNPHPLLAALPKNPKLSTVNPD